MTPAAGAPSRFAQLTYSYFHRPDGSGGDGWQVKDTSGGITPEEERLLVNRVSTNLDVGGRDLKYLSAEEIGALPRRLVYGPLPGGARAWWHTVPTGTDSSGRPGSVFVHIVVDRTPGAAEPALRPSDLLGSPTWLRPFGVDEVLASTLAGVPDPPEWPGGGHDRVSAVAFVAKQALWRGAVLAALLDAVVDAMAGGPTVALGIDDDGSAEEWISAVCHLMSPGTSRELFWSTAERVAGLDAARAAGLHLAVVPVDDLAGFEPDEDRFVLISVAADAVELGDLELPHVTRWGPGKESRVAVTPWSGIVPVVVQDPQLAITALELQDRIAAESGDRDLACGWPLAMVVAALPDQLGEAVDEAALLLKERPPPGLDRRSKHYRNRRVLLERRLGRTTADAWAAVCAQADEPPGDRAFAENVYLERALRDDRWLLRPEQVPLPALAVPMIDAEVVDEAAGRFAAFAADPAGRPAAGADRPAVFLRLLDTAVRAGLPVDAGQVTDTLDRLGGPQLLDPVAGAGLMERVGPLADPTIGVFVRPWFDRRLPDLPGRPGCRLTPTVLRWLHPSPPAVPAPGSTIAPTLAEAAAQATFVLADPSAFRPVALAAVLSPFTPEPAPWDVPRIGGGSPLPIGEVAALLRRYPPAALVPAGLGRAIAVAGYGHDLVEVLDAVQRLEVPQHRDDPAVRVALLAATARRLEGEWWAPGGSAAVLARFLDAVQETLTLDPLLRFADTVERSVVAAHVAATATATRTAPPPQRPAVRSLVGTVAGGPHKVPGMVAVYLEHAIRNGVLRDVDLFAAAQVGAADADDRPHELPWLLELSDLRVGEVRVPEPRPVLDEVVRLRLAGLTPTAQLVEAARRRRRELSSAPDAREEHDRSKGEQDHERDRAAKRWWNRLGVTDESVLAPVTPRWFRI